MWVTKRKGTSKKRVHVTKVYGTKFKKKGRVHDLVKRKGTSLQKKKTRRVTGTGNRQKPRKNSRRHRGDGVPAKTWTGRVNKINKKGRVRVAKKDRRCYTLKKKMGARY